jgi:hypothetical protein
MEHIVSVVVEELAQRLSDPQGLPLLLGGESGPPPEWRSGAPPIVTQNLSPDLADQIPGTARTGLFLYTDKVVNDQREKFTRFSGHIRTVIEVRVTNDRVEGMQQELNRWVTAIEEILHRSRGSWRNGTYFGGEFEVEYGPIRRGGRHLIQAAKIRIQTHVRLD